MSATRRVAISMGDPTGIGPEVIIKAVSARGRTATAPILVGDPEVFVDNAKRLRVPLRIRIWTPPDPMPKDAFAFRAVAGLKPRERRPGHPTIAGGKAAYASICEAVRLVQDGFADGIVTGPICKANLVASGSRLAGHTELLAELTDSKVVRMMMVGDRLRVILVTIHLALREVPRVLSRQGVYDTISLAHSSLGRHFGVPNPRIAVVGLNPHAGESGLFGHEERDIIAPAVERARRRGMRVVGPLPADSAFPHAVEGRFDVVVCMYHDQGLAPFKLLHFRDGVNCTIGLPFVRTSPDHGTAHDIAGRGIADPSSMAAAISLASQQARVRRAA